MPRPKAPCGTYTAYKRHLRLKETVDDACRAAQREHDGARSTSAPARAARQTAKQSTSEPAFEAPPAVPLTDEGHISRLEVLKETLETSRALVKQLQATDPARAYLQMREQREILREIAELQGNGQVKGVTLADQLAEARERRRAAASAAAGS